MIQREQYEDEKEIFTEKVAENIKAILNHKGITQKELSQKIYIDETALSKSLKALRSFNAYEFISVVKALDVSVEELTDGVSKDNKDIHYETGLSNFAINYLKSLKQGKGYLLEIINLILENETIAEALFEAIYLYSVSNISQTYFQKEGTVNERQARFIADNELLMRYAIVGSFEEILKLIKKKYERNPENYFNRNNENKMNEMCKNLGKNLHNIKNKNYEIELDNFYDDKAAIEEVEQLNKKNALL